MFGASFLNVGLEESIKGFHLFLVVMIVHMVDAFELIVLVNRTRPFQSGNDFTSLVDTYCTVRISMDNIGL